MSDNKLQTPGQRLVEGWAKDELASRIDKLLAEQAERMVPSRDSLIDVIVEGYLADIDSDEMDWQDRVAKFIRAHLIATGWKEPQKRVLDLTALYQPKGAVGLFSVASQDIIDAIRRQLPDIEVIT